MRSLRRSTAAIWAIWSTGVLLLAAMAAALPTGTKSLWGPELTAAAPPIVRWDAGWYMNVAQNGYSYSPDRSGNTVRFYPLYPLLTRAAWKLGVPLLFAGIVVSLISLLAALLLMVDLLAERSGADAVLPGIATLLFFPTSFYFTAYYTESLFLLTTVAAFWAAGRGRWALAGLAGAAASLTRLNGVLILVPILWLLWESAGRRRRGLRPSHLLPVLGTIAGALAYPVFLWMKFGSALIFFQGEKAGWAHRPTPVWQLVSQTAGEFGARLSRLSSGGGLLFFLNLAAILLFLALTLALFLRRELAGGLYAAATLLLLLNSGSLDAMMRYVLSLFPCLFLLSDLLRRRPVLAFAYAFLGAGLLGVLLHRFVHWKWVA